MSLRHLCGLVDLAIDLVLGLVPNESSLGYKLELQYSTLGPGLYECKKSGVPCLCLANYAEE